MLLNEFRAFTKECVLEVLKENLSECMNPSCERSCVKCNHRFSGTMVCPNCGDDQTKYQKDRPTEGFDPTSQGPNPDCKDNPYPAWNNYMRHLEENDETPLNPFARHIGDEDEEYEKSKPDFEFYKKLREKIAKIKAKNPHSRELPPLEQQEREWRPYILHLVRRIRKNGYLQETQGGMSIQHDYQGDIDRMRKMEEAEEHGRYAQMSGAGDFDPRTFGPEPEFGPEAWTE